MIPKQSFNSKEVISLLSKLKSETPDYPADLLATRKNAFLKQAATLNIPGDNQGGFDGPEGGTSASGGSGTALGSGTAGQSILLQALIGFSLIAAMVLAALAFRGQIGDILQRNEITVVGETITLIGVSTPTAFATVSPELTGTPSPKMSTGTPTSPVDLIVEGGTLIDGTLYVNGTQVISGTPDGTKTNSGLHLGQTPGTPSAPGKGNPGNRNQPDKPAKPPKPTKPPK